MVPLFMVGPAFGIITACVLPFWAWLFARHFLDRAIGHDSAWTRDWGPLRDWTIKGLVVPIFLWAMMNIGFGWSPILTPREAAPGTTAWLEELPGRLIPGACLISCWWLAVTSGWYLYLTARPLRGHPELRSVVMFWSLCSAVAGSVVLFAFGIHSLGLAVALACMIVLHFTAPLSAPAHHNPSYAQAIGHMKLGHYTQAEESILRELEHSPDDFDGWLMLAELYARHFDDLQLADHTIRELATQGNLTPFQISLAFHRLADWHLELATDPVEARHALEAIGTLIPGSHFDRMAGQRIRRLPATARELRESREPHRIRLPALTDPLDDQLHPPEPPVRNREAAIDRARELVERLRNNPDLVEAREEFAHLLAEQLDRPREAIEQVQLLLGMPGLPLNRPPAWKALIASWQLRMLRDSTAARGTLEALLRDHPDSPQALAARRRLNVLRMESNLPSRPVASGADRPIVQRARSSPGPQKPNG